MAVSSEPPALNLVGTWAHALVDALAQSGIQDLIVTPGSRSTPFALAALLHSKLRCTSAIDERSAAFLAVGMAKATEYPAALLCTSGTAPAHFMPALIEASLAYVPVIVITADRPTALQDCGAPQTIDQVKLFGTHVRWFTDLGEPSIRETQLRAMRRMVAQSIWTSRYPVPGPVHINARANKPLEPRPATTPEEQAASEAVSHVLRSPIVRAPVPEVRVSPDTSQQLAKLIDGAKRGVVVCGPAPISQTRDRKAVFDFAAATGFPLLAEATSQLRFAHRPSHAPVFDAFDTVLRTAWGPRCFDPDLIVQVGAAPTSGGWSRWPGLDRTPRIVIAPHGWQDPQSSCSWLVNAPVGPTLASLTPRDHRDNSPAWRQRLQRWDALVWSSVEDAVQGLSEKGCTRALLSELPSGALLAVGNSLPVRHLDTWCPGNVADVHVLSQRGANGIDGIIAGAVGACTAMRRPTALFIGDVSFSHDMSSLALARMVDAPLAILVLNNAGGRIFDQLPIARLPGVDEHLDYWRTPPRLDIAHAAAAFGIRHRRVEDGTGLEMALRNSLHQRGVCVIEAVVPPTGAVDDDRRLVARLDERGPE